MLKYALAGIAGIVGLFVGVTIAVLITNKAGTISSALGAGLAIGSARLVYGYFKKREDRQEFDSKLIPKISNEEKLNFEKAFAEIDCVAAEISEVNILVDPDRMFSFRVGIRSPQFYEIEKQLIREELYRLFPSRYQFDFADLNDENVGWKFSKGTRIVI